jgi:hypothetical protein
MADALVLDFHGPIAFVFSIDGVSAYLPYCDEHTCNLLTDSDDVSPMENKIYTLVGPRASTPPVQKKGANLIVVKWGDTSGNIPKKDDCYCIFKLPLPDFIFGLRPEYVKIVKPDGGGWSGLCARGVRFYYKECKTPPQIDSLKFDATSQVPLGSDKYRIEIRYHDTNNEVDEENPHEDAELCSENMRKLFPPLDKWTVDFDDPNQEKTPRPKIHGIATSPGPHGVDCGANGLVFNDGGIA